MALDSPGKFPAFSPPRRGPFRPASRWSRLLPKTPPAAAKASATSAPGPWPLASLRCPPKSAKPPRSAPPPAQTFRSVACGTRPANKAHRPAATPPAPLCPSPAAPEIHLCSASPSEIPIRNFRSPPPPTDPRNPVPCGPTPGRLPKEAAHVGGKLIFVAENEIRVVIEHLARVALCQRHFALHRHQHRCRLRRRGRLRRGRLEQQWQRLHAQNPAGQHGVGVIRVRDNLIICLRQELVDRRRRQLLLDAIGRRLVLHCRHGDHVNALRQRVKVPRGVIPAAGRHHTQVNCQPQRSEGPAFRQPPHPTHPSSHSASFIPLAADNRKLSAAPQNHQAPARDKSARGSLKCN